MTTGAYRVARAAGFLKAAFTVAVGMNLAEALWDPSGLAWTAARLTAAAVFTVALVAYVALHLLRWRRTRSGRP
ncbi:hypothetical protein ACFZCT_06140 [Streptomyces qaidamensis]|jgi:hypothetical protein|uniref:hypothetical protein n=1 Tax=Streptomyces qaidamensis TaxID=1783515 RepID=UPI0036E8DA20